MDKIENSSKEDSSDTSQMSPKHQSSRLPLFLFPPVPPFKCKDQGEILKPISETLRTHWHRLEISAEALIKEGKLQV